MRIATPAAQVARKPVLCVLLTVFSSATAWGQLIPSLPSNSPSNHPAQHRAASSALTPQEIPELPPPNASDGVQALAPNDDSHILDSRSFGIPFNVASIDPSDSSSRPVEVHLYMSRGPGSAWAMKDRQQPGVTEFQFVTTEDGPYWFATRTIDSAGRPHPTGALAPQLKVYVDTTKPIVKLNADSDAAGQVVALIETTDATPIKSIQLHYVTDSVRQWRRLGNRDIQSNSKVTFRPDEAWQQMSLQVIVTDAAGNQSVETRTIHRPRVALQPSRSLALQDSQRNKQIEAVTVAGPSDPPTMRVPPPAFGTPGNLNPTNALRNFAAQTEQRLFAPESAESIAPGIATPDPRATLPNTTPYAFPNGAANASNVPVPMTRPPGPTPQTSSAPATPARTLEDAMRPLDSATTAPAQPSAPQSLPPSGRPALATPNGLSAGGMSASDVAPGSLPTDNLPADIETIPTPEPSQRQTYREKAYQANRAEQAEFDLAQLSDRVPVRYSDSLRFSLDYELEAVSSLGVQAVELYGSTDNGKTWKRWGADPDRTSPFDIETNEEGVFGFRIVVIGRNGLKSPGPLSGEAPDIAVVVDQTAPQLKITSARYGEGNRTGALVIQYECDDPNLMNRPIALSFSRSMDGPWSTIAAGLRNDGIHAWPADPQLPRQIYLRIDGTDNAGNIGTYILDQPIDTQGLAPRARILGFQTR